jgi:hypothetical protein
LFVKAMVVEAVHPDLLTFGPKPAMTCVLRCLSVLLMLHFIPASQVHPLESDFILSLVLNATIS